ncbi:MAG TPA: carboxypeptidase-like regulatory domain-containing protein, partial [Verrucomicrobiae bacterium]|nr:carboxypeptidase-like regulatory domain-containing protein [Verrucomicrobiae bacterium]
VVSSVDGSPVPRAHLTATPALSEQNGERQLYRRTARLAGVDADADEHGRFVLTVPSVGRWRLVASAIGFVTQAYNAHDAFSSAVVLSQTHPQVDLQFRIAPEAEISGTVLDEAGEAVRNARVVLEHRPAPSPDREQEEFRNRMVLQTDDRGMYDFSGLAPGDYRVMVDAKPWYSTSTQPRLGNSDTPQDSALDVTYQLTWYPGVDDPAEAEVFSLKPGDIRRADFQLTPVPAVHISFTSPAENGSRRFPSFPVVERIGAGGAGLAAVIPARSSNGGKVDVGGLAPGLYRIRMAGPNQEQETKLIEIRAGDSRIVDGTVAASEMVNVTIANESSGASRAVGAELIDTEKGTRFTSFSPDVFFRARPIAAPATQEEKPMVLQVPPGRYEVRLADHEAYLLGISAKGAEVAGRFVVVHGGDVTLKLHTATGRASVHGIAATNGIPVEGAMVLLVPAGLDDPSSFTRIVRDQTNTDGSFDLNDVIPGQYILIAVTNGWQIPWDHAATVQRYLTQGIPLELGPTAKVEQNINSQKP